MGGFCPFVRHRNKHVRQITANELDTLDKRGYKLLINLFLINIALPLRCQQTETELTEIKNVTKVFI